MRGTIVRGAVGAVVGGAAFGAAKLANANRSSKPKLTKGFDASKLTKGLDASKLTKGLDAKKLASHVDVKRMASHVDLKDVKRLARNLDLKDLLRQIGDIAEQVEARSEDVHTLSGQAKRITRRIS